MALHCFNSFSLTLLHSPSPLQSSFSILAIPSTSVSRVHLKHVVGVPPMCLSGVQIKKRKITLVVGAAADGVDGTASAEEGGGSQSEEVVSVEKLPLESKLKERQEQKLRMKLAKKIRLRRKRLVRKRKLRKKGRWPPSKMKKLKNV